MIQIDLNFDAKIVATDYKYQLQMNERASLVIASIFGLVAGMSHGVVSHYQELPFSLSQQVIESFSDRHFD